MRLPWADRAEAAQAAREVAAVERNIELAAARIAEATASQLAQDMADEDRGWTRVNEATAPDYDIKRSDLERIRAKCIALWQIDGALAQAAHLLKSGTFGGGISPPKAADKRVQEVVDRLWDDDVNQQALFSREAMGQANLALVLEGERFFSLHTSAADDAVKVGVITPGQVTEAVTHPEDARRVVLWKREFRGRKWDFSRGAYVPEEGKRTWYYRDWRYSPQRMAEQDIRDNEAEALIQAAGRALQDDVCLYQFRSNTLGLRGIPEAYRAYDWSKAHARALSDLTTLVKALAMFAWKKKVQTRSAADLKALAQQFRDPVPGPGAVQVENQNVDLQPIDVSTGGQQNLSAAVLETHLESIRGFGFGSHWYSDPRSGNLATATAMELPAQWRISDRQAMFEALLTDLSQFAITCTMQTPRSPLVALPRDVDRALDLDFPPAAPWVAGSVAQLISAYVQGMQSGLLDEQEAAYQSYVIMGSNNIEAILERQFPPETKLEGEQPEVEGDDGDGEGAAPTEAELLAAAEQAMREAEGTPHGDCLEREAEAAGGEVVVPPFGDDSRAARLEAALEAALQARVIDPWHRRIKAWLRGLGDEVPGAATLEGRLRMELMPDRATLNAVLYHYMVRAGNLGGQRALDLIATGIVHAQEAARRVQEQEGIDPRKSWETLADFLARGGGGDADAAGFVFNLRDPSLLRELQQRGTKITGEVTQTMLSDLRETLTEQFYRRGAATPELLANIDSIFPRTYRNRAENIARTEIVMAQGTVLHKSYEANGIKRMQWSAYRDEATRSAHWAAHGQVRKMGEPFSVGGQNLRYPGDPNGSPANICRCRCDLLPVIGRDTSLKAEPWLGEDLRGAAEKPGDLERVDGMVRRRPPAATLPDGFMRKDRVKPLPQTASASRTRIVCGGIGAQEAAIPSSLPRLFEGEVPCAKQRDQDLGDRGERMINDLFGTQETRNTAPFDALDEQHRRAYEIKVKREDSIHQQIRMGPPAKANKANWLRENPGYEPHTVMVIAPVDPKTTPTEIYMREGYGSFRRTAMEHVATVEPSGVVQWHL